MTDQVEHPDIVRMVRVERTMRIVIEVPTTDYKDYDGNPPVKGQSDEGRQMTDQEIRDYELDKLKDPDGVPEVIQEMYENAGFSNPPPELTCRVEFMETIRLGKPDESGPRA